MRSVSTYAPSAMQIGNSARLTVDPGDKLPVASDKSYAGGGRLRKLSGLKSGAGDVRRKRDLSNLLRSNSVGKFTRKLRYL